MPPGSSTCNGITDLIESEPHADISATPTENGARTVLHVTIQGVVFQECQEPWTFSWKSQRA